MSREHLPTATLPKAPTGISGFDDVTLGGLPAGRPTLICGGAGCGKTLFAITFLVNGATPIDSTDIKAQRAAFGEKGRRGRRLRPLARQPDHQDPRTHRRRRAPLRGHAHPGQRRRRGAAPALLERAIEARYILADKGYDADALRHTIGSVDAVPVIPGRRTRTTPVRHDRTRYKERHLVENAFCKDLRRVATRYDKLATNFLSAVAIATLVAYWL